MDGRAERLYLRAISYICMPMKINIDEYEMGLYCYECEMTAVQPRIVISMSMENPLNGEIHLHKKMGITCHGERMMEDRKDHLITHSYDIDDTSESYEKCGKLAMRYIDNGYEITYLKLG